MRTRTALVHLRGGCGPIRFTESNEIENVLFARDKFLWKERQHVTKREKETSSTCSVSSVSSILLCFSLSFSVSLPLSMESPCQSLFVLPKAAQSLSFLYLLIL